MTEGTGSRGEPKKAAEVEPWAAVTTLGSVATPIALLLTGMLYLSGRSYHIGYLEEFGLHSGYGDESVQVLLAQGFLPLVYGTPVVVILSVILWFFRRQDKRANARTAGSIVEIVVQRRYTVALVTFVILIYGIVSGSIAAAVDGYRTRLHVSGDCKSCFTYRVRGINLKGEVVSQDKDHTCLYTRGGLIIFRTDDLSLTRL